MKFALSFAAASATTAVLFASFAAAQTPEVIFTEIVSSSTSDIPGALDLSGLPVATKWRAMEDLRLSHDGSQWMLKGRTQLGSDLETILVLGSGTTGTMFAQEGQQFQGAPAGELYDFFDSRTPASFDTAGNIGFSARAKNAAAGTGEKVVVYDSTLDTHTIAVQQGDLVTGAVDDPVGSSGDETLGNSVGSVNLLDNGEISYAVSALQGVAFDRRQAMLRDAAVWRQEDVSPVTTLLFGATVYSAIDFDESGTTPDGLHWFIKGDALDEPSTSNRILVVDGVVELQESLPIDGTAMIFADVFQTQMVANGDWVARGDDPAGDDWVVHNGDLVLRTGDSVGIDQVGISINAVACNQVGDWVAACSTTGAAATSDVVLLNGDVVMREGDPIDVDGNGMFDDGAFLGRGNNLLSTFAANDLWLSDDLQLYFLAYLNDGAGGDLIDGAGFATPDAFMRIQLTARTFCDDGDGSLASCPCAPGTPDTGCEIPQATGGVGLTLVTQEFTPQNRVTFSGSGYNTMGAPTSIVIRSTGLDAGSPVVFGDGLRCVAAPLVRLGATVAVGGASTHTIGHGTMAGSGDFYYQLWFRSTPISFCDPTQAFNLSNGRILTW